MLTTKRLIATALATLAASGSVLTLAAAPASAAKNSCAQYFTMAARAGAVGAYGLQTRLENEGLACYATP